ncbi:MAG: hypothetical protein J5I47_00785 [Vicingus serpentipes]|nr:hypothetical protein [Vicingus serpentipes]
MKKINTLLLSSIFSAGIILTLNSCKKAETPPNSKPGNHNYLDGVLIANEGTFGSSNGSVSYYNPSFDKVDNNVFSIINGRPLGDVVQSINRHGSSTYICVNGSNKIEVVNSINFKEVATITAVSQPRYMVANGTTGYVSSWSNGGEVAVIDLNTNLVLGAISVNSGPEKMAIANNNLYVMNSGGFGIDSTISVIDLNNNTVSKTIILPAYNPTAAVKDNNNNLWVLAKGRVIYDVNWNYIGEDPSMLFKINTTTNTIESTINLFATGHPNSLDISPDGNTLYMSGSWGFKGVYTVSTSTPTTPTIPLINELCYGLLVNTNNGNIFLLQEASSANGKLIRYNSSGTKLGEYTVGIFPNGGSKSNEK